MASTTEESTRQRRIQALNHMNAALEDFDEIRLQDPTDLDAARIHVRAAYIAYEEFVGWHIKFPGLRCEEAEMDTAQAESTAAFRKINAAKA